MMSGDENVSIKDLTVDEQTLMIIACLKTLDMEKQLSIAEQIMRQGAEYRAVQIVGTLLLAIFVTGALLIMVNGRDNNITQSLILGLGVASICLFIGSALFFLTRKITKRNAKDPLTEENLKTRMKYERDSVGLILELNPTDEALERTSLELSAQADRYAGHSGARNEFFRNYKDILLAVLLIVGVTPENATGLFADIIQMIKWMGAFLLFISFCSSIISSARSSKYKFWLSLVALARYQMRLKVADSAA